ncbi:MAG: MATE family efflux transporter [Lachnospiraceae bacterium]|nr:MATE family efflux transporter [Lachnospiraceae bacterium]MDY3276156.1 MATE family efflux transporter [Agathobacter sp.]MDY5102063.1 MATE family efflux transporter [Agathobacter sp.]
MKGNRKTLTQLFVPICLETLLYMLAGMIDTLMLSSVGDQAVGAVGTANTYIGIFIIMFSIISSGMVAVMTQNIGAGRDGVAYQARQLGLAFNAVLGIGMSIFLFTCSGKILSIVGVAAALQEPAEIYLRTVGGACILNALIPIFSSYLRAFGFSKQPLYASILGNIINLVLNAVFLFVFDMGVQGVAYATVISRMVNLLLVVVMGTILVEAKNNPERIENRKVLGQIIKIGLPSAFETALYNVAMTLVIRFLNQMDAEGLNVTARSYTAQITNFSYCVGAALAQANAIMTGWRIGANEYDECDRGTKKAAIIGVIVAACVEAVFALSAGWIMQLFTDNPQMIALVQKLLFIDLFLEMGRVTNLVYGNALKTSGDAIFPVVMGAAFMFLCAVGGTYLFGIRLGFLAVGAYIGLAADECVRAVGMFLRWRSGKWRSKGLVRD